MHSLNLPITLINPQAGHLQIPGTAQQFFPGRFAALHIPGLDRQRLPLHGPAYLHAEGAGFVLVQRQAGGLLIDQGLRLRITLDAPGGEQPVIEKDKSAENQANEAH